VVGVVPSLGVLAFDVLVHVSGCLRALETLALSSAPLATEEPVRIDRAVSRDGHGEGPQVVLKSSA
jgi:hypothetical protein